MGWSFLNVLIFALSGYLAMYILFKPQTIKYEKTLQFNFMMQPFLYIYIICFGASIAAFFIGEHTDFIEPLTITRLMIPFIGAAIIYASYLLLSDFMANIITIACISAVVFIQPLGIGNAFPTLSPFTVKIAALIFSSLFCIGNRLLNIIPHTFIIPNLTILLGLCILSFVGASPLYIAACAAALSGTLCAYLHINFYEIKIDISNAFCTAVSYLICSLLLMNLGEYSFASCLIFTMVFWAELISALWNRYFVYRSGYLYENTNFYLAAQRFSIIHLTVNILRISVIILFIGWFQLFASNQYSLMIVSLLFALWLNHSLGHPGSNARSFKEINKEFINDLKQNINETKNIFTRRDKE